MSTVRCWQFQSSHRLCGLIRFFFSCLPLNSIEAVEETEDGVSLEREGEGETESDAEVEVESKAEAEGEPEGEAEHAVTHLTEAERFPDLTHKPSGAQQEGAGM